MKPLAYFMAAVVVLSVVTILGFASGSNVTNAANSLSISNVKLTSVYYDVEDKGLGFEIDETISNPTSNPVTINKMMYFVSLNGVEARAKGPESVTVPADSTKTVQVTATLNSTEVRSVGIKSMLKAREVRVGVGIVGEAPVTWYGLVKYSSVPIELSGNTTQEIGPLLTSLALTSAPEESESPIKVLSVKWFVNGKQVTSISAGEVVTVQLTVEALKDLHHSRDSKIEVDLMADIKYDSDWFMGDKKFDLNMGKGGVQTLKWTFTANVPSNLFEGVDKLSWFRGYYIIVYSGKSTIGMPPCYYFMPSHYPPRLKVSVPRNPISVTSVEWYVGNQRVTSVKKSTYVTAVINLKVNADLHNYKVKYCARADIKYLTDKTAACREIVLNVLKGGTASLSITFKAKHHWLLRGYFIYVKGEVWDPYTWVMPSHYPPRLKVH